MFMVERMPEDQRLVMTPPVLGRFIRDVRIASGLTQADAAALCGVSGPFLSALEGGKPTARIGLALKVCHGLGIQLVASSPVALPGDPELAPRRIAKKADP